MKGTIGSLGSQKRAFILLCAVTKNNYGLDTNSLISGLPWCFATIIAMYFVHWWLWAPSYPGLCPIPLFPYCGRHNTLHISIQSVFIELNNHRLFHFPPREQRPCINHFHSHLSYSTLWCTFFSSYMISKCIFLNKYIISKGRLTVSKSHLSLGWVLCTTILLFQGKTPKSMNQGLSAFPDWFVQEWIITKHMNRVFSYSHTMSPSHLTSWETGEDSSKVK